MISPRAGSQAIPASVRAGGARVGWRWNHESTEYAHVWFYTDPLPSSPPNRTVSFSVGSKANEALVRAGGENTGWSWVQLPPTNFQVSSNAPAALVEPPNRRRYPSDPSHVIAAPSRPLGWFVRLSSVQRSCEYVQVSESTDAPEPPNRTRYGSRGSQARAASTRAGGEVGGERVTH